MRTLHHWAVLTTIVIAGSTTAYAEGGGSKSGSPPSSPSSSGGGGGGALSQGNNTIVGETGAPDTGGLGGMGGLVDLHKPGYKGPKPWEIGVVLEMKGITCSTDCMGEAADKAVFHGYLYGFADITRNNRISARVGFTQAFLADQGESGTRMDDVVVSYTRLIPLPAKFKFRIIGSLAFPTSYFSQKLYDIYLSPTGTLRLSRVFEGRGGALDIDFRLFAGGNIVKYNTDAGGNPNTRAEFGGVVSLEYEFWFLRALSIGADVYDEAVWKYDISSSTDPNMHVPIPTQDATYMTQPIQQVWGGEIFARYAAPPFGGIHVDFTFAYFHGDPTLGYNSINHDGIARVFPSLTNTNGGGAPTTSLWGQTSGFYGALTARY